MKILILGATGLLGQHLFVGLKTYNNQVFGTIRNLDKKLFFQIERRNDLINLNNVLYISELEKVLEMCWSMLYYKKRKMSLMRREDYLLN